MRRSLFVLLVLSCVLSLQLAAQEPIPVEVESEGPTLDIEALRAEIQEILDEGEVPGASVALVTADRTIWAGGVGKADVAAGIDVTGDHLFRVGSISKSFTALAVLTAVEDGLIDLTAAVRSVAPEVAFTNRWEATHPVTVANVMEHTTGFDDIHFREYAKVDDPEMNLAEGLAFNPNSRITRWKPGTHMSYCNSGPAIAAYILEKVTGTVFEDYAREHVFDVLGMETATFHYPGDATLMAKGYESDSVTEANYDHIIVRPSGALNASSTDMARYLRMMINRGTLDGVELLRPETIARMETPTSTLAADEGFDFGYGLGNYASIINGHRFQGHNGGITGFVSTSAYSSELGVGYFVSINKPDGALRAVANLLGERLAEGFDPPEGVTASLEESELQAIAGYYEVVTPRSQLMHLVFRFLTVERLTLEEGELFAKGLTGGEKKKLIPVTATSLRSEDQPVATRFLVVDDDDDGNLIQQQALGSSKRKISALRLFSQFAIALVTLLLMLSSVLFALVWMPLKAFGRLKAVHPRTMLAPLLATLCLVVAFILPLMLSSDLIQDLGSLTGWSLTVYIGSLAFVAATAFSLYTVYRSRSIEMSGIARCHAVFVSLACAVALAYVWTHGLIGLRTWEY